MLDLDTAPNVVPYRNDKAFVQEYFYIDDYNTLFIH